MIYELRVYTCLPGRMPALQKRFQNHTLALWEKHGIRQAGFWTTLIGPASNDLTYMLAWENLAEREGAGTPSWRIRTGSAPAPTARRGWPDRRQCRQLAAAADRLFVGSLRQRTPPFRSDGNPTPSRRRSYFGGAVSTGATKLPPLEIIGQYWLSRRNSTVAIQSNCAATTRSGRPNSLNQASFRP